MEKVSVLMTVYNAESMINETIPPLLKQSYSNIEIIIVNDGSSDNSASIIQDYCKIDNRIVFINRTENKGRVFSLNEGLEYCSGKYIAINDADDISTETRIEEQISFIFDKGIQDRFGVVGSANITEDRTKGVKEKYRIKTGTLGNRVSVARIFLGMPFIHSSFIYNSNALFSVGGFAREVTQAIDYFTLNKICRSFPVYAYPNVTVTRVIDGENYFLRPEMIAQKERNRQIIYQWQRENFKLAPLYQSFRLLNSLRKR